MSRFMFGSGLHPALALIFLSFLVTHVNNQVYCSAYCSYFYQANTYAPMCTGPTSADCTKCDDTLFALVNTNCKSHGYFNQSLQFTQLISPIATNLTGWVATTNLFRVNTQPGPYELMEFYTGNAVGIGGNDKVYKQFTNIPPHYTVRLRFFVLRSGSLAVSLDYWIDHLKYHYDTSQYPTSSTLGDIVTTDKIFHQFKNLTVTFDAQLTALNEFIGIKQLLIFVSKCSNFCQFCNSSQNCVKCFNVPNDIKAYLQDGYCYEECPQTYFKNDTFYTCDKCQPECQNCIFNSTFCTQCKSEGRYETFLYNNTCHYNCPDGYFKNYDTNQCSCPVDGFFVASNHRCQACASECNSCFGPTQNMCYNCSAGNYLIYGRNECSNECPAGQYGNEFARKCELCSPLCSECEGKSSKCKACFFATRVRYLYDNQCVSECPRGYGRNLNLRICEICLPYYYSYKGDCLIECPDMYIANNESKSCIYIGQTNYSIEPRVIAIQLLPNGKALRFELSFSQGLTESSKNWIALQSYYNISLIKNNGVSLYPKSVSIENDYTIGLVFQLNELINEATEFSIEFSSHMNTTKNINYGRRTKTFKVSNYPEFLADYFENGQKSFFNTMMIPIILTLAILIGLRVKGTYDLLLETIRLFQFIGLTVFLDYPLEGPMYSFLQGFNYFNLEFLPNIYNWFVPIFRNSMEEQLFYGFRFIYGDMDFIRMVGSILVFFAIWIALILVLKCFVVKKVEILGWVMRLGMDLVEIKIMHSFWNSVIFTFANSKMENIYILWVHFVSYIFMGLVSFRYYKIYQSNASINYSFIWRLFSTLFISIALFNKMIVLIVLTLVSFGVGLRHFYLTRDQNKGIYTFKFGLAFLIRDFVMALFPFLSIMAVCMMSFYKEQMSFISIIIILGIFSYLLTISEVIILIFVRSFWIRLQKNGSINNGKQNKKGQVEYNKVEQHGTLQSISQSFHEDSESYIKDQFSADFANAHQQTVQDEINGNQIQNDSGIRKTVEKTLDNSSTAGKIQITSSKIENQELRVDEVGNNQNKLYPQDSKINENQSDHDEELFQSKVKRAHRTEALKRKDVKVEPLQTLSLRKSSQTQFQHITLKKVEQEKQFDRQGINTTEIAKKSNKKIMNVESSSSPGLKTNLVRSIRQQSQNSKIATDQNIFVNEDYVEQ